MTAYDILKLAHQHGVQIRFEDGQLFLEADSEPPTELINIIKDHKTTLLAHYCAGEAQIIKPLDHSNDEIELHSEPQQPPYIEPEYITPFERLKQRAMKAYDYELMVATNNLIRNGYSVENAKVSKLKWRDSIQRMHLSNEKVLRIERELIEDGLLAYDCARTCLVRGDGSKVSHAHNDNPDFILADDTGKKFCDWYFA